MITADKLKLLTNFPAFMLTQMIQEAGHKKDKFESAKFLGITNAGQFCYSVTDPAGEQDKVFLSYNSAADQVTASY